MTYCAPCAAALPAYFDLHETIVDYRHPLIARQRQNDSIRIITHDVNTIKVWQREL